MPSLWWVKKEQLDNDQLRLIDQLPLRENFLITGPPGSGKTNVLIRRAQFVRSQGMPNVLLLTFTRPLTEFVKTGCFDPQGREIFPQSCVTTLESWQRSLYRDHKENLPVYTKDQDLIDWKRQLATSALEFYKQNRVPPYDALFVDEAQDLLAEEVQLIMTWSPVVFFVGDDRQKIYDKNEGLDAVRKVIPRSNERILNFHYRIAPKICQMADRIILPTGGNNLASTAQYSGPTPATIDIQKKLLSKDEQLEIAKEKLKQQIRVYGDLIKMGDRLGIIVALKSDRDVVFQSLEQDDVLRGKSKIIKAKERNEDDPSFEIDVPICILTVQGCKGLEFRTVHWLFADELKRYRKPEHYYTVVTRAKTSLDIYYTNELPQILARAHSEGVLPPW